MAEFAQEVDECANAAIYRSFFEALKSNNVDTVCQLLDENNFTSEDLHDYGMFDVTAEELEILISLGLHIDDYTARGFIDYRRNDVYGILMKRTTAMPIDAFRRCHGSPQCIKVLMNLGFKADISDLPSYCADNLDFLKYAFCNGGLPKKSRYARMPMYYDRFRETVVNDCIYSACRTNRFDILSTLFSQRDDDGSPIFRWNSIDEMMTNDSNAVYMIMTYVTEHPESLDFILSFDNINLSRIDDINYFINNHSRNDEIKTRLRNALSERL